MTRIETEVQANILLTIPIGKKEFRPEKTLTPTEFRNLNNFLISKNTTTADLLEFEGINLLKDYAANETIKHRIVELLRQGTTLAISFEKWERAGIWAMSPSHEHYPKKYLDKFGDKSPPVIFGAGKKELLSKKGIGIVGSRNVSEENKKIAYGLGEIASEQAFSVISGGAKGVDELSMRGAINKEGQIIGVMSSNLLKTAMSKKYRDAIARGDLTVIAMVNPEAGFNVGAAMQRNKYIYALSELAIAVCSTIEKGGTWTGATENLKNNWVPLYLGTHKEEGSGNEALVDMGGHWLPELDDIQFSDLISKNRPKAERKNVESPTQLSFGI